MFKFNSGLSASRNALSKSETAVLILTSVAYESCLKFVDTMNSNYVEDFQSMII